MLGLIYINIQKEINFEFSNKIAELNKILPEATFFELDNHSDSLILQYASRFIDENDQLFAVIDVEEGNPPLKVMSLFNKLFQKGTTQVFVRGDHVMLNSILQPFHKVRYFSTLEELIEKILISL